MTQRPAPADPRETLVRLTEGLDYYRAWRIAELEAACPVGVAVDLDAVVAPGSFFLEIFDQQTRKAAREQILKEVRTWYAVTAQELRDVMESGTALQAQAVQTLLSRFRADVGFDFFTEAGLLHKTVNAVLARRRLADDAEWEVLQELVTSDASSAFTTKEVAQCRDLMTAYEAAK